MMKYILLFIGMVAASALVAGKMRQNMRVLTPREEPSRAEASRQGLRAPTSATFPSIPIRNPAVNTEVPSVPIAKKESIAPTGVSPKIIAQSIGPSGFVSSPMPSASATTSSASASSTSALMPRVETRPLMPSLDEKSIFSAVVKIECPSEDRKGIYVASGFALPRGVIVTAAHFIKDSGSDTCQVIFPEKRAPSHYLAGKTEDRQVVRKRHDEQGIDVAFLFMPLLAAYPEARAVFPDHYPFIPYPICTDSVLLGDRILHFGYPGSYQANGYLDMSAGEAVVYADINGIKEELSEDQTYLFKTPIFGYTRDQSQMHPYLVSRSPSFYGDSGGLAFDATRQCIVGPDRGGTTGGGAGENFSIFLLLGWQGVRWLLP